MKNVNWSLPPVSLLVLVLLQCPVQIAFAQKSKAVFTARDYADAIHSVSEVMIHDVVGPTSASRYYAYITLAAYEAVSRSSPVEYRNLNKVLNDYPEIPPLTEKEKFHAGFASLYCTLRMGAELLPSGYLLDTAINELVKRAEKKLGASVSENTMANCQVIIKMMVQYSAADHFREIFGMPKYTPLDEPGKWKPTPPAYMQALDPHWNKLRPFTMQSADQLAPPPCAPFSDDTSSSFYRQALETYETGRTLTPEQRFIADYWDCNPFAVQQIGHIDYGLKKISPGGHWMSITGIVCEMKMLPIEKTTEAHALVAVALADGFISCWDEKYRSNRIRPETFINEHIDRSWQPLIQTPPFPEYPSGHSVASNASAAVLTKLIGDHYPFTDDTEIEFGLTERSFPSFNAAAAEASISRLYGGIHFRDAIESGAEQGRQIGEWVLRKFGK